MKNIVFFILAVAISLFGASHRWGDSVHSSGFITGNGGKVRHTRSLESGYSRYSLVATARVKAPYQGDARVVLEGTPELDHDIYLSSLSINLGINERPRFEDHIIYNLQPGDKINLRIVIREPASGESIKGRYILALYDTRTGKSVINIPLNFKTPGTTDNEKQHQHK